MLVTDFKKYKITNFTPEEVIKTGAKLDTVNKDLLIELQKLRTGTGKKIFLLKNGINTGKHNPNGYHPKNKAIDVYIDYCFDLKKVLSVVIGKTKFRGVGFYRNSHNIISVHLDLRHRDSFATWIAYETAQHAWAYLTYPEQVI